MGGGDGSVGGGSIFLLLPSLVGDPAMPPGNVDGWVRLWGSGVLCRMTALESSVSSGGEGEEKRRSKVNQELW